MFGAPLLQQLRQRLPDLRAYGLGGPALAEAGLNLLADVRALSAVGLSENLQHLGVFRQLLKRLKAWLQQVRPQLLLLIDFQGLNLQLAAVAQQLGIRVVYYLAPQDWIWRLPGGTRRIARRVDQIISVFPPEASYYRQAGLQVNPVGHPLLDLLPACSAAQARQQLGLPPEQKVFCWMPGSRQSELKQLLPPLRQLQARLRQQFPEALHLWPVAAGFLHEPIQAQLGPRDHLLSFEQRHLAILSADLLLGASGNLVLEAALLGTPMLALYRVSPLTYALARHLVRLPYVTLPNLLLGREAVPEFIQQLPEEQMLQRALQAMAQPEHWKSLQQELHSLLGPAGGIAQAAELLQVILSAAPPEPQQNP